MYPITDTVELAVGNIWEHFEQTKHGEPYNTEYLVEFICSFTFKDFIRNESVLTVRDGQTPQDFRDQLAEMLDRLYDEYLSYEGEEFPTEVLLPEVEPFVQKLAVWARDQSILLIAYNR